MKFCLFIGLLFSTLLSFSQETKRDLLQDILQAETEIEASKHDADRIKKVFASQYQALYNLDPRDYDLDNIRRNTTKIIKSLFRFRTKLEQSLGTWDQRSVGQEDFQNQVRGMIRAVHNLIDVVAEISLGNEKLMKGQRTMPAFQGGVPWTITPDDKPLRYKDFKTGDVLLMRGGSSVSASIARITDLNSLFSHAAVVYVDEKTGKKYVVEALIEHGAIINPLEQALDHGVARMLALRPKNTEQAKRGATLLHDIVKAGIENNRTFKYDFTMAGRAPDVHPDDILKYARGSNDPELVSKLKDFKVFCSLLVELANNWGSDGKVHTPSFRSGMNQKNRAFLRRLGIPDTSRSVFAPGDMEIDLNYRVIGDFREPMKTAGLRVDDFIFDKIFDWMERDNLVFNESKVFEAIGVVANKVSEIGFLKRFLQSKGLAVAPHVPAKVISTVLMLESMRNTVLKQIKPSLEAFEKQQGLATPPRLIYQEIEKVYQRNPEVLRYLIKGKSSTQACRSAVAR